jgi:hypothetical protein
MFTETKELNGKKYISCHSCETYNYHGIPSERLGKEFVRIYIENKFRVTFNEHSFWEFNDKEKAIQFAEKLLNIRKNIKLEYDYGLTFGKLTPYKMRKSSLIMKDKGNPLNNSILSTLYSICNRLISERDKDVYVSCFSGTASEHLKQNKNRYWINISDSYGFKEEDQLKVKVGTFSFSFLPKDIFNIIEKWENICKISSKDKMIFTVGEKSYRTAI